jgi:hypothetical protein
MTWTGIAEDAAGWAVDCSAASSAENALASETLAGAACVARGSGGAGGAPGIPPCIGPCAAVSQTGRVGSSSRSWATCDIESCGAGRTNAVGPAASAREVTGSSFGLFMSDSAARPAPARKIASDGESEGPVYTGALFWPLSRGAAGRSAPPVSASSSFTRTTRCCGSNGLTMMPSHPSARAFS